jgi:hypothetical protein
MALLQKAYLGAVPLFRESAWFEFDSSNLVDDNGFGDVVTANSSAHTKGAWSELIASTAGDASLLVISAEEVPLQINIDKSTLVDIGVGASGSETALLENIAIGGANFVSGGGSFTFAVPIKVASGTRLSARIQSVITGGREKRIYVAAYNMGDYDLAPTSVDVIGTSTTTSAGTPFSGASGTWFEVLASTTRAYRALVVIPSNAGDVNANVRINCAAGVGASGSEQEIGSVVGAFSTAERTTIESPFSTVIGKNIAAGSRLALKPTWANAGQTLALAAANQQNYAVTLIGIP